MSWSEFYCEVQELGTEVVEQQAAFQPWIFHVLSLVSCLSVVLCTLDTLDLSQLCFQTTERLFIFFSEDQVSAMSAQQECRFATCHCKGGS